MGKPWPESFLTQDDEVMELPANLRAISALSQIENELRMSIMAEAQVKIEAECAARKEAEDQRLVAETARATAEGELKAERDARIRAEERMKEMEAEAEEEDEAEDEEEEPEEEKSAEELAAEKAEEEAERRQLLADIVMAMRDANKPLMNAIMQQEKHEKNEEMVLDFDVVRDAAGRIKQIKASRSS